MLPIFSRSAGLKPRGKQALPIFRSKRPELKLAN
jgi:hypothetical protein